MAPFPKTQKAQVAVGVWWESLRPVWEDGGLGGAAKLAFAWMWWRRGSRPGNLSVTTKSLGAMFGRTHRPGDKWLDGLARRGLIDVIARDGESGKIELYVNRPGETIRQTPVRPDPQAKLPGFDDSDADLPEAPADPPHTIRIKSPPAAVSAQKGPAVCAQKRPRPVGEPGGERSAQINRPTDRPVEVGEVDWVEAHRLAAHAARWVKVKRKAAETDARLLLFAAVLVQSYLPEDCVFHALDVVKKKRPRNGAAYFRRVFGEEVAKWQGKPEDKGPRALSELERQIRIPDAQVKAFLRQLDGDGGKRDASKPQSEATPEELAEARRVVAEVRANLRNARLSRNE